MYSTDPEESRLQTLYITRNMKNLFSSTCCAAPTWLMIPFPATVYFRVVKHNTLSLLQSKQRNKEENLYEL